MDVTNIGEDIYIAENKLTLSERNNFTRKYIIDKLLT